MDKAKTKLVSEFYELPNPELKSWFAKTRMGNSDEYRTTFYRGKSPTQVVKGWLNTLGQIESQWPTLWEFEKDLAAKVGPLSIQKPLEERMGDIDHYYEDILLPQTPISDAAIAAVLREWSAVRGLQIRDQATTLSLMKKSTSSGSPYHRKKRSVMDQTVPCEILFDSTQTYPVTQILPKGTWFACAELGWRGQEGGPKPEDVKQRVVWMFPFAVNVAELQVYQPLIESAQRFHLVPAWISNEAVDVTVTRMFNTKAKQDLVVCTDFSKFDQHFGASCQSAAESLLGALLAEGSNSSWLKNVFPVKYNIPLMYDYGKVRTGHHGMGSGSGGTNADETLVHRALQYEAAQRSKAYLNPNSQCLGDDGVLTWPGITVEDVVRSYTAHGLEMNPDKQYASRHDCVYLRRWHHEDYRVDGTCVGVYSTCRALGKLCEQERFFDPEVWGPEMVALRQLSIIENVKYHPLREAFVDYCMKGDRYRLGLDLPGFMDNLEKISSKAIDYMPDFLGYTRSLQKDQGITSWWIYKYLKSQA